MNTGLPLNTLEVDDPGRYVGYFQDSDQQRWEVAWNPRWPARIKA